MGYLKRRKIPKYFQKVVLDYYSYMSDRLSQDSIIQELPQTIQVIDHLRVQHPPRGRLGQFDSAKTMAIPINLSSGHTQADAIGDVNALSCCPQTRLSLLLNRDLLKFVPALRMLDLNAVVSLMQSLYSKVFLPGEYVFKAGDAGLHLFFIKTGTGCVVFVLRLSIGS